MPELPHDLHDTVVRALNEDVGAGDVTASLIPEGTVATAHVICREEAVICGQAWFDEVFRQLSREIVIDWHIKEGAGATPDTKICSLRGPSREILTGERTALNFLQTLSATATQTRRYVDAIKGTRAQVLDTRKTLPGLRLAQKYAVACGGGKNHRLGLYDAILIKENHIMATGSIRAAIENARRSHPQLSIEIETENLDEFQQALAAGADIIMLDNYSLEDMKEAVRRNNSRCKLEVSGGVELERLRAIAQTGVDYISVGALTKDIKAVDLSMRFELT